MGILLEVHPTYDRVVGHAKIGINFPLNSLEINSPGENIVDYDGFLQKNFSVNILCIFYAWELVSQLYIEYRQYNTIYHFLQINVEIPSCF